MKNLIIGILIGMLFGGSIAWAATMARLQSADGVAISASNPLYIENVP